MFQVNEDNSIYLTRGDMVFLRVKAQNDGEAYIFQPGEVLRIKVFGKKDCENVVLQKDFPVTSATEEVDIILEESETKIGGIINKPTDYWYEVELNPFDFPRTIIGYGEDGPALFRLYPEGRDIDGEDLTESDLPYVDDDFDMTSTRPVQNQVIARAFAEMKSRVDAIGEEYISVSAFGATGDGRTDDTKAIQTAINSLNGKAGNIFLPQGQYRITAPIIIKSNINIRGVSSAKYGRYNSDIPSTVIFYDGENVIESVIEYDRGGATVFGGGISNLSIDGREKANYIIDLRKSGRISIENNSIVKSLKAGVYAYNSYEHTIEANWFGYNKGYAIILDSYANANVVRDNAIELSNQSSGILLRGSNGNVISGNMIEGGVGASIGIHVAAASFTTQNIITENRIEFESHRYEGQTEGICILIGEAGNSQRPNRNFVNGNAVFNQVILSVGTLTEYNRKNEFVDYGLGTITDFYDYTVLNENAKMIVAGGALEDYNYVDDGFSFTANSGSAKISLKNAIYTHPVVYQAIDARALRGEDIAVSCMMKCNSRAVSVGVEFYKNGTGMTWQKLGTYITAHRKAPFDIGTYQLVQTSGTVPDDCDTAVLVFNFGQNGQMPSNTDIDVKWCKLTRVVTWK